MVRALDKANAMLIRFQALYKIGSDLPFYHFINFCSCAGIFLSIISAIGLVISVNHDVGLSSIQWRANNRQRQGRPPVSSCLKQLQQYAVIAW